MKPFFSNNNSKNKKAIVTLTMFSMIIISVLFILLFSYYFYDYVKENGINSQKEQEVLNSLTSFRAEILNLIPYNNSNMTYSNSLDPLDIQIYASGTSLIGTGDTGKLLVSREITTLGFNFCSNYTITPHLNTTLIHNSSCISVK